MSTSPVPGDGERTSEEATADAPAEPMSPELYSDDRIDRMLAVAELPLSEDRRRKLAANLFDLERHITKVRSVRLGETPPANSFDARWS